VTPLERRRPGLNLLPKIDGLLKSIVRLFLVSALAVGLSACASRGGKIPYAPENFGPPDAAMPSDRAYDLPLGPLDVLRVSVFRVPELSGEYQVDAKGMIDLPLLGPISVRSYNPEQFALELERLYSVRYLNDPEVTIRVMSTSHNSVTVEGGVNSPGIYSLPGRTTLVGAIALARGIAFTDANPRRVAIFRKSGGKTMAAAFDLVAIRRGEMEDPPIYPGDTIVVDSSQVRPIYRDIVTSLPILSLFLTL
jgi:polysaccharide biosynthesis/export protein